MKDMLFVAQSVSTKGKFVSYSNIEAGKQSQKVLRNFYANIDASETNVGFVPAGYKVTLEPLSKDELVALVKSRNGDRKTLSDIIK